MIKENTEHNTWLYATHKDEEVLFRYNGINNFGNIITEEYYWLKDNILINEGSSAIGFISPDRCIVADDIVCKNVLKRVAYEKGLIDAMPYTYDGVEVFIVNEPFYFSEDFNQIENKDRLTAIYTPKDKWAKPFKVNYYARLMNYMNSINNEEELKQISKHLCNVIGLL